MQNVQNSKNKMKENQNKICLFLLVLSCFSTSCNLKFLTRSNLKNDSIKNSEIVQPAKSDTIKNNEQVGLAESDTTKRHFEKICNKFEPYLELCYSNLMNGRENHALDTVLYGLKKEGFVVMQQDTFLSNAAIFACQGLFTDHYISMVIKLMNRKQNCIYIVLFPLIKWNDTEICTESYIRYSKWHDYELDKYFFFEYSGAHFPIGKTKFKREED
jgi:hypothetical protein